MKTVIAWLTFSLLMISCGEAPKPPLTADGIVNRAIDSAGGDLYQKVHIAFDFRNMHYESIRNHGFYEYNRTQTDSLGNTIQDIIGTDGYRRLVNGAPVQVIDSMANKYTNSVNSVHYFAYLPYGLNDKAVQKTLLENVKIKEVEYYKIKVTFTQEGGGEDFEDVFLYWIDKNDFSVDYLAYLYHTDGGGIRFREAFNVRRIGGIRFSDYHNLKPVSEDINLFTIDSLFSSGSLEKLSEIKLENVSVKPVE
ncbi:MAG: DUF6503 family protein [Flavobacteriaceae bacterium]|nr:DUF6503 family protein [Flavobacteriaceae bacterium]